MNDIRKAENLERLSVLIRRLHALDVAVATFDPLEAATHFAASCKSARGAEIESALAQRVATILTTPRHSHDGNRLCHNDIGRGNFIDDGNRLWLVDWECAGFGDPYYDLAIVSHNNRLSAAEEITLLSACDERSGDEEIAHLARMKIAHDWYHVCWYALQSMLCETSYESQALEELHRTRGFHHARLIDELRSFDSRY
jgi:thiamine kinase-like enzyme